MKKRVVLSYTQEECEGVMDRVLRGRHVMMTQSPNVSGECWITDLSPTKEGGYPQVHMKKGKPKALLHHVALRAAGRLADWTEGHDVSHLCGERMCCNPDHLCVEPSETNQQRKGCAGPNVRVVSPGGEVFSISLCSHFPRCMKSMAPVVVDT